MSQTVYNASMAVAREGSIAQDFGACVVESAVAEAAVKYGLLVRRGTTAPQVAPLAALGAADPDAFTGLGTPVASAALAQTILPVSFVGVIGAGRVTSYAGRITFTLNASADWDDTFMEVYYETPSGSEEVETVQIPNGGNAVVSTVGVATMLRKLVIDAQSGAGGTMDVGIDYTMPNVGLCEKNMLGVALVSHSVESFAAATEVPVNGQVNVLRRGAVWVVTETAVTAGDPVYVRVVAAGADVRGQFAGDPDSTNYVRLAGAHFLAAAGVDGLVPMWVGGSL